MKTDVLIIGSGIAGLFAALKISDYADVIVVTKKEKAESNTNYAQGGIASVIDQHDSFEKHIEDTLIAGAGLCRRESVELMVKEGPDRIRDLIEIGTQFTKRDGGFDLAREGGHSMPRILHAKDFTGKEIERALIEAVSQRRNIQILENYLAIDLLTEHNLKLNKEIKLENQNCWGAYLLNCLNNQVIKITAKATILATGGLGQVYLHTTNPKIATGDGFAMAYRAGVKLGNMEFIQFHPTALYGSANLPEFDSRSFLISEAVRGFGGILRTKNGEEFMHKYDHRKELAPRDIVARAIDNELKKSGDEFVYLDITHKNSDEIVDHFPNIYNTCLKLGIDITKQMIPVVPAAHYACGGIVVDANSRTSLRGLYACGEVSMTGVHGANRLASNSLLEAIVFSHRAAKDIKQFLSDYKIEIPEFPEWDDTGTLTHDEKVMITHTIKEVKHTMWDYVGIVRSNERLHRAQRRISILFEENEKLYKKTKIFQSILEARNLIACAHVIIKSAQKRKESRGLHFNIDYPEPDPEFLKDTIIENQNY
ncbi:MULTISPECIES: L-aspartate oxidase [Ignavibacterium]|jgi:L-aspartate oxidase|uniref:L-aspartate oxidase n=1 Tax=Ignavibacterium TaxID=795750 RepID=UPI0025BC97A5|nr:MULTISPECIES: L-aspartate oxidase [Ignavibacterium]